MDPQQLQLLVTREMPYGKYKGRLDHNGLKPLLDPMQTLPDAEQRLQRVCRVTALKRG
ncbi:MAG: DUF3820 family protein [Ramlibacter sp.]|nr:DUF3820 family protein [Ramlibacter sp.]